MSPLGDTTRFVLARLGGSGSEGIAASSPVLQSLQWISICADVAEHDPRQLPTLLRIGEVDRWGQPLPWRAARMVVRLAGNRMRRPAFESDDDRPRDTTSRLLWEALASRGGGVSESLPTLQRALRYAVRVPLVRVQRVAGREKTEGVPATLTVHAIEAGDYPEDAWRFVRAPASALLQTTSDFDEALDRAASVVARIGAANQASARLVQPVFVWHLQLPRGFTPPIEGASAGAAFALAALACLTPSCDQTLPIVSAKLKDNNGHLEPVHHLAEKLLGFDGLAEDAEVCVAEGQPALAGRMLVPFADLRALLGHVNEAMRENATAIDAVPERLLDEYCDWVRACHSFLELPPGRNLPSLRMPLERVYVALRAVRANAHEIAQSQDLFERQLVDATTSDGSGLPASWHELSTGEQRERRANYLRDHPYMPSLAERDGCEASTWVDSQSQTLAEAFRTERRLVLLGDPGAGKSTVSRWLARRLADAVRTRQQDLWVSGAEVSQNPKQRDEQVNLGPARLPVVVEVAKLALDLQRARGNGLPLLLAEWLCKVSWRTGPPTARGERIPEAELDRLFRYHLRRGALVVVLDGLDEVPEEAERAMVVEAIEQFANEWMPARHGVPFETGGNQLVVTSRIAGYHLAPLRLPALALLTIEPMRREAIEHFCTSWMAAVHAAHTESGAPAATAVPLVQSQIDDTVGLLRAIFDSERPGIEELASNPLLVTVLATLYLADRSLPSSRVELYQKSIELLIESRDATDAGARLTTEEIVSMLEPVAAYIHDTHATGLIGQAELVEQLSLSLMRHRQEVDRSRVKREAASFVRSLQRRVGLLAARGESVMGFLHLTFQEYLAGLHLIHADGDAAARLAERIDDARWREPLLLAIGFLAWREGPRTQRQVLMQLLELDDRRATGVPQAALLIVDAVPKVQNLPPVVFRALVARLVRGYSECRLLEGVSTLPRDIEAALLRLRSNGHAALMDEVLSEALSLAVGHASTPAIAPATAELILVNEWYSPRLVEALASAIDHDSAEWGWPIERALRELTAVELEPLEPKVAVPDSSELEQLRFVRPQEFRRTGLRYRAAALAHKRYQLRRRLCERSTLDRLRLPLRLALECEPALCEYACADWRRLAAIVATGGGYANSRAEQLDREYREIARFLQRPDDERERVIDEEPDAYVGRFGNEDVVYTAAVYLDTGMGGRRKEASAPVEFTPRAIHRASAFDGQLEALMRGRVETAALIEQLRVASATAQQTRARADAWLCRIALGDDISADLHALCRQPDGHDTRVAMRQQFERVLLQLADPLHRGRDAVLEDLHTLNEADGEQWIHQVDTVLGALCAASEAPVLMGRVQSMTNEPPKLVVPLEDHAPTRYRHVLRADAFFALCTDSNDEATRGIHDAMDVLPEHDDLVRMLLLVHNAPNLRSSRRAVAWELDAITIDREDDAHDLPPDALDALRALRLDAIEPGPGGRLVHKLISALGARAQANPDLWPQLQLFSLALTRQGSTPPMPADPDSAVRLSCAGVQQLVAGIRDPLHRARSWITALPLLDAHESGAATSAATAAAELVEDTTARAALYVRLLDLVSRDARADLAVRALELARGSPDAARRGRLLLRLSRALSDHEAELWREALEAALSIASPVERAEMFGLLRLNGGGVRRFEPTLASAIEALPTRVLRARALGTPGLEIAMHLPPALAAKVQARCALWVPVLLAAAAVDVIRALEVPAGLADLWRALVESPTDTGRFRAVVDRIEAEGAPLTRDAAAAVSALLEAGEQGAAAMLLPLLERPTPDALPWIRRWLQADDPGLRHHAGLLLAEFEHVPSVLTWPSLVWMLDRASDRSRYRALLLLTSRVWGVEAVVPTMAVSQVGAALFDRMANSRRELGRVDVRRTRAMTMATANILHDDGPALMRWIAVAANPGAAGAEACWLLSNILHLTDATWPVFLNGLTAAQAPARRALFESLCMMLAVKGRLSSEQIAEVLTRLRSMDHRSFVDVQLIGRPEEGLATVLVEAASAGSGHVQPDDLDVGLLAHGAIALADLLRTTDDAALCARLSELGGLSFHRLDGSDESAERAAMQIVDAHAPPVALLLRWLSFALEHEHDDGTSALRVRTGALLRVASCVAARMPATVIGAAMPGLAHQLADATREQPNVYARRAAVRLLGLLHWTSRDSTRAVLGALRDDRLVQQAALDVAEQLVGGHVERRDLVQALEDPSVEVACGACLLLSAACSSRPVDRTERQRLIQMMVEAMRFPNAQRGQYRLAGSGKDDSDGVRIVFFGRLRKAFQRAVLRMTGVGSTSLH